MPTPIIVRAMYDQEITICTPIDDMDLQSKLQSIKYGSHEYLFDHNINPNDTPENLQRFFISSYTVHSRYQAIAQFKQGMVGMNNAFSDSDSYRMFHSFLVHSKEELQLDDINQLFLFHDDCEKGSNKWRQINDAVCDFQLTLASVSNGEVDDLLLQDVLVFLTGSASIPKHRFEKKIDLYFSEEVQLPTVSTCGLSVTLPLNDIENALKIAWRYAGGFDDI